MPGLRKPRLREVSGRVTTGRLTRRREIDARPGGRHRRDRRSAFDDLVEFTAIKPHAPALRAVVDLNTASVTHYEQGVIGRAFHTAIVPEGAYASTGCSPSVSGTVGQSFHSRSSE